MERVVVETAGWIRSEADAESVEVTLVYEPADPFAVRVVVDRENEQLTWVFARDLLADGLRSMSPIGEGRVQIQATSVLTEITYAYGPEAAISLRIPWWNTREFIRLCQTRVPRGDEALDMDALVAALTSRPEPGTL